MKSTFPYWSVPRRGSVPEVLVEGLTGYIVESVPEAVNAVSRLDQLNRCECRRVFEERFTDERMARDYLRVYERLAKSTDPPPTVGI